MKKLSVTTVLLLALILGSTMAYAGFNWDGDPIFKVDKTTVKVLVSADEVLDPSDIEVWLYAPESANPRVVATHGFDCWWGFEGSVEDGKIPVRVTVDARDADGDPVDVWVTVTVPKYGSIDESDEPRSEVELKIPVKKKK